MGKRFTMTEKWEDVWFLRLRPAHKLMWNYLCDKCDLAGFWEINIDMAVFQTKLTKTAVLGAIQGLSRGYLSNGTHLWLRTFIRNQANYPLNPKNHAHKHIIGLIALHTDFGVNFDEEMLRKNGGAVLAPKEGLISPIGKGKGNSKGKGKEYTAEFLFFWRTFKGRYIQEKGMYVKGGKREAFDVWETLAPEQQKLATAAGPKTGGKTTKDACRWLQYERWEDFEKLFKPAAKPVGRQAPVFEPATTEEKLAVRATMPKKVSPANPKSIDQQMAELLGSKKGARNDH